MPPERNSDAAYEQIEHMIIHQGVEPGSLVSESELMQRTGIGRTPVREALQRLARNRMVEIHPNKGVLIPPISIDAELKSLEIRRVLEGLAVRLACVRATEAERQEMREILRSIRATRRSLVDYMSTVKGTHDVIARGSHNPFIVDALAPLQGLSRRFWLAHVTDAGGEIKRGATHHTAILRAILARDEARAEEASGALNDYLVEFSIAALRE